MKRPARSRSADTVVRHLVELEDAQARGKASPFVGRDHEVATLDRLLDDAGDGRGRVVLVSGEAGIGKSRLATEVAAHARRRGFSAAWGRTWESGGAPPYWPWVEVLRRMVADTPRLAVPSALEPLVSGDATARTNPVESQLGGGGTDRFQIIDAIAATIRSAAEEAPRLLVLEDLHAADHPTILALRFLARNIEGSRALVLATYREVELRASESAALMNELARDAEHISLGRLGEADLATLIDELLDGSLRRLEASEQRKLIGGIYERSQGIPLFVREITRLLRAACTDRLDARDLERLGVSDRIRETIRRRLGLLTPACREALAIASIAGKEFDVVQLTPVVSATSSGDSSLPLTDLLVEAIDAEMVFSTVDTPGKYYFHALVRDALYEDLAPSRRANIHRVLAESIEPFADRNPTSAAAIAHHHRLAGTSPDAAVAARSLSRAIRFSIRAGEIALAESAYEESIRFFEQALQTADVLDSMREAVNPPPGEAVPATLDATRRTEILIALGRAQRLAGRLADATSSYQAAAAAARTSIQAGAREAAGELLASAVLGLEDAKPEIGAPDERRVSLIREALDALGESDSSLRAVLSAHLASALYFRGDLEEMRLASARAAAIASRLEDRRALARCLLQQLYQSWRTPEAREREENLPEIGHLVEEIGDADLRLEFMAWEIFDRLERGDFVAAATIKNRYVQFAREAKVGWHLWYTAVMSASHAIMVGEFDQGEAQAFAALTEGQSMSVANAEQIFGAQLCTLRFLQGRTEEIAGSLDSFASDNPTMVTWRCARLGLLIDLPDREEEARRELARLSIEEFTALPADINLLTSGAALALACHALQDPDRATALYPRIAPYEEWTAVVAGAMSYTGPVAYYLGLLAEVMGKWDVAANHFERAERIDTAAGALPNLAMTRLRQAEVMLQGGDAVCSLPAYRSKHPQDLIQQVLHQARSLGMKSLAMRAENIERSVPRRRASRSGANVVRQACFVREGDFWTIGEGSKSFRLKSSKGLRLLHYMIRHPGCDLHAMQLSSLDAHGEPAEGWTHATATARTEGLQTDPMAIADEPPSDANAVAAYRKRLADLSHELEEAKSWNDLGRVEAIRGEIDFLAAELSRATGLDRGRRSSAAQRARVNVTKQIRDACRRIASVDAGLGRHLSSSVKTGIFCVYDPDPTDPVRWQLQ